MCWRKLCFECVQYDMLQCNASYRGLNVTLRPIQRDMVKMMSYTRQFLHIFSDNLRFDICSSIKTSREKVKGQARNLTSFFFFGRPKSFWNSLRKYSTLVT